MSIEELLDGHVPTEAWLSSDRADDMLSRDELRPRLYRAMHPRPEAAYGPLLRALLAHEVSFRRHARDDPDDLFENLYWCALLLSQLGDVGDSLLLWRAKHTSFDTSVGLDVQCLVGAGVAETLAFLAQSTDRDAPAAAKYIAGCAAAGDFDDLDGWLAARRRYFD